MLTVIQGRTVLVDLLLNTLSIEYAGLYQRIGIQLASGALLGNLLVHQRLRAGRLVCFVVTAATVANQVDNHIALELHAVVNG